MDNSEQIRVLEARILDSTDHLIWRAIDDHTIVEIVYAADKAIRQFYAEGHFIRHYHNGERITESELRAALKIKGNVEISLDVPRKPLDASIISTVITKNVARELPARGTRVEIPVELLEELANAGINAYAPAFGGDNSVPYNAGRAAYNILQRHYEKHK